MDLKILTARITELEQQKNLTDKESQELFQLESWLDDLEEMNLTDLQEIF